MLQTSFTDKFNSADKSKINKSKKKKQNKHKYENKSLC